MSSLKLLLATSGPGGVLRLYAHARLGTIETMTTWQEPGASVIRVQRIAERQAVIRAIAQALKAGHQSKAAKNHRRHGLWDQTQVAGGTGINCELDETLASNDDAAAVVDGSPGRRAKVATGQVLRGGTRHRGAHSRANLALQAAMEVAQRRRSIDAQGRAPPLAWAPGRGMTRRSSGSATTGTCSKARRHRRFEE